MKFAASTSMGMDLRHAYASYSMISVLSSAQQLLVYSVLTSASTLGKRNWESEMRVATSAHACPVCIGPDAVSVAVGWTSPIDENRRVVVIANDCDCAWTEAATARTAENSCEDLILIRTEYGLIDRVREQIWITVSYCSIFWPPSKTILTGKSFSLPTKPDRQRTTNRHENAKTKISVSLEQTQGVSHLTSSRTVAWKPYYSLLVYVGRAYQPWKC